MIHVAYCFDRNYRQHVAASIASVLLNFGGDGAELHIHLVTDSTDAEFEQRLDRFRRTYRARIEVLHVTPEQAGRVSSLPTVDEKIRYMPSATWFRMLLPALLPSVDRLIYLDADTIVQGDLRPLWDTDLAGAPLAAVQDMSAKSMAARLGLPQYVNSGVMLFDMVQWRAAGLVEAGLTCGRRNASRIVFADQCVFNMLLEDRIRLLPAKWNAFATARNRTTDFSGASIIHYITEDKPWQAWYENPAGRLYWRYLDVSPWAGTQPESPRTLEQSLRLARLQASTDTRQEALLTYERIVHALGDRLRPQQP